MKNIIFSLLALFVTTATLLAQPLAGSSNYEQLVAAANANEAVHSYHFALEQLTEAYEIDEDDKTLIPRIAEVNYKLRDYAAAERWYRQIFRRMEPTDTTYNEHRFYYGRSLKIMEKHDDAIMMFQDFLRHTDDEILKTLAEYEITGAEMAQNAPEETSEVAVEDAGRKVNSLFSEYSPALSSDDVLYFSSWEATEVVVPEDLNDPKNFSRIFMSQQKEGRKGEKEWERPEALSVEVNRPGAHTANPAISSDGRKLYYNRVELENQKVVGALIYASDVDDTGWKSGNVVEGVNGEYLALQPAMGELFGKEVMFFTSDMPGGFGGMDIYYATLNGDNSFEDPVNLGEQINTIGDDEMPFYFDGTLYFSTTGRPTMGGYDIYYSVWDGSAWSDAEHMGVGFNTSQDDLSFKLYGDGYRGFLTSNRQGGRSLKSKTCCDDIYEFQIAKLYADLVVGVFTEARKGLPGGTVTLIPVEPKTTIAMGGGTEQTKEEGNRFDYGLELENAYLVTVSHPDYYPDTFAFDILGLEESKTVEHRFFLKAKPLPPPPAEFDTINILEDIRLENILYDFNKSTIRPESEDDLNAMLKILNDYPEMVIQLSSHTDARGDDSYNRTLSKRRADSARRWLVRAGVDGDRMKTEGFGETVPQTIDRRIVDRYDWLSMGDILTEDFIKALATKEQREAAHELNRRTEFKILEGPTQIIIKREILERKPTAPERNSLPVEFQQSPTKASRDSIVISHLSSLVGTKDLKGLPILDFEHRQYQLGPVKRGKLRNFEYSFTNRGDVDAKVMIIQACECTTIDHDDSKVYAPGESGIIKVTFDSTSKEEDETITIDIYLEQTDRKGVPIVEALEYSFELIK
jgi:peptidoglycan-associated lipoprotein